MSEKKILITGITGQDGAYLAQHMLDAGHVVYGGMRRTSVDIGHRLHELGIADAIRFVDFELTDQENIVRLVREIRPDEVYNLAAQSFVGSSWNYPAYTSQANGLGVLYILEAIRNHSADTRFYQASTSEMFGMAQQVPQSETTPFYPRSPYGVAKLYAHWMTKNYRESFDQFTVSGILFNHESPLRGVEFVTRKITLAFARIAQGKQSGLELGNLDSKRDWGYAKDYVAGMAAMLSAEKGDDYVLATGQTHSIRAFVELVAQFAGFDIEWIGAGVEEVGRDKISGRTLVRINPKFYRPAEVDLLVGDPSKAERVLGWKTKTDLHELAEIMYKADFDRAKSDAVFF